MVPALCYLLWSPGVDIEDGRHDRGTNGIWMSHRWLGDDAWFTRNNRESLREQYRDPAFIDQTLNDLADRGLKDLFPHLAPTRATGRLPNVHAEQVTRFLEAAERHELRVMPWVGGVFESHCRPADPAWRENFVHSTIELLNNYPTLTGIHLNIEPWPNGNADCLTLLEELEAEMPKDKILSVAAYPPPTLWQRVPEVHWDEDYFRQVARRCDQLAVMMYDTSIPLEKPYIYLMQRWTQEVLEWSEQTPVLLGLPCYADQGVDYHKPEVENLTNALLGIHAGMRDLDSTDSFQGVALYSLWEMDHEEWKTYDRSFKKPVRRE